MKLRRGSKGMEVCAYVHVETLQPTLRKKLHSVGGVCMLSHLGLGQFHQGGRVLGRGYIREGIHLRQAKATHPGWTTRIVIEKWPSKC